jgi:hypothetical protein
VANRVARFLLDTKYQSRKNITNGRKICIPNRHLIYPMAIKIPKGHDTCIPKFSFPSIKNTKVVFLKKYF